MKVSLICTVYNEAKSIHEFLASIAALKRLPDELIVVDAGSKDGTLELLREFADGVPFPVKILVENGCNIARGRNIATMNASHEVIVVTDAGCCLDNNWIEEICAPFSVGADVVGGWYQPDTRSDFERVAAFLTFPKLGTFDESKFLPSSRSLAYKKEVWAKVGGYPEWLTFAGEDTLFDLQIIKKGYKIIFQPQAVVFWRPRSNLKSFIKQWYLYGLGDGEAGQNIHSLLKIWVKFLLLSFLLAGALWIGSNSLALGLVSAGALYKFRRLDKWSWVPMAVVLFVSMRLSYVVGFGRGLVKVCRR